MLHLSVVFPFLGTSLRIVMLIVHLSVVFLFRGTPPHCVAMLLVLLGLDVVFLFQAILLSVVGAAAAIPPRHLAIQFKRHSVIQCKAILLRQAVRSHISTPGKMQCDLTIIYMCKFYK